MEGSRLQHNRLKKAFAIIFKAQSCRKSIDEFLTISHVPCFLSQKILLAVHLQKKENARDAASSGAVQ